MKQVVADKTFVCILHIIMVLTKHSSAMEATLFVAESSDKFLKCDHARNWTIPPKFGSIEIGCRQEDFRVNSPNRVLC